MPSNLRAKKAVAHRGPALAPIDPNRAVQATRADPIGVKLPAMVATKRAIEEVEDDDSDSDSDALEGMAMDSCDVVRRKIRALIDSKEMKVGEFCEAIGVSNNSYNGFLRENGRYKGSGYAAYHSAWRFFKKRELKGIPAPTKKRKAAPSKAATIAASTDVTSISLPGEDTDSVQVYDTCDEIRRKINLHLKKDGVTQASFLRDLMAQYHTSDKKIQSKQLTDFRSKKGPDRGNTSCIYYASYVFFEKLRIKEGKKKTATRETMEQIYRGQGGMDTERVSTGRYLVGPGRVIRQDKFGRVWSE